MNITAIAGARIPSDTANSLQVMKVCQALVQLGHKVTLLVPAQPSTSNLQTPNLQTLYGLNTAFNIEYLPALGSFGRRLFTLKAVLHAQKSDLVYTWFPQSAVFALLARRPVVFEIHEPPSGLFGPLWYRLFAALSGRKRLLSITQALVQVLNRDYGTHLRTDEIIIGPNGVDIDRFASLPDPESARRQIGLTQAPTVLCTGHLYAGRGADLFLALAGSAPDARFAWVGGRPQDVAEWRGKAAGLANVTFTGFVPNQEIPLHQAAGDVLLMPYGRTIAGSSGGNSAEICSPMKMFEYMAAGRAILTSDLPVIREVLDETTAVFCPPEDVTSWQASLRSLLDDPSRRKTLGESARRAVEKYTWQARAERTLSGF
jgi:glycosyltransferase involved in cell wall biosynthesis